MSLLKYIYRLKRMDDLIRRKATGDSDEFAKKIGISRSVLMENLREMRQLGASIAYCQIRNSYQYIDEFDLIIGQSFKSKIKGGFELISLNDLLIRS